MDKVLTLTHQQINSKLWIYPLIYSQVEINILSSAGPQLIVSFIVKRLNMIVALFYFHTNASVLEDIWCQFKKKIKKNHQPIVIIKEYLIFLGLYFHHTFSLYRSYQECVRRAFM